MRKSHLWFNLSRIDFDDVGINSIGVGRIKFIIAFRSCFYVFSGNLVRSENAVFGSCFNGHVGHAEAVKSAGTEFESAVLVPTQVQGFANGVLDSGGFGLSLLLIGFV